MGGFIEEPVSSTILSCILLLKIRNGSHIPGACDRPANIPVHHGPLLLAHWGKKKTGKLLAPHNV